MDIGDKVRIRSAVWFLRTSRARRLAVEAVMLERKLDIGFDQFCFSYPIGLTAEESIRSIELFGREVLPRFG